MTPFKSAREVIQAMLDGKKVRKSTWKDGSFYAFNGSSFINSGGNNIRLELHQPAEWEVVEETPERYEWLLKNKDNQMWIPDDLLSEAEVRERWNHWEIVQRLRGPFK